MQLQSNLSAVLACGYQITSGGFEPTLGVTSTGAVFYHPAAALGLPETVKTARSTDQGRNWTLLTPGVAGQSTHPYSQDPYLYVDPTTDRLFVEDLLLAPPTCGMLSFSDDEGATWTNTQSGCAEADHVSIFAGPARTSPTVGYPNIVYRCAINGGALAGFSSAVSCQSSLDGGLTWQPPGTPPFAFIPGALDTIVPGACYGGAGHGAVGPDGTLYLPRGHCGQPMLAISKDEGLTWTTVQVSKLGNACDANFCEHDGAFSVDTAGNLYYAFVAHDDRLLYLVHSTDGGATWSQAQAIQAPGLNEAALVQIAAGGPGRLAIAYLGTSSSPGAPFSGSYAKASWGGYMGVSLDALADKATFASAPVNATGDPLIRGVNCGPLRCDAELDFIDVRIAPDGSPWAAFVDGCSKACAERGPDDQAVAVAGHVVGAPSLWDAADPNGPYPS